MSRNPIFPLAYKVLPEYSQTIYYLGFPSSWKNDLLEIARAANPRFKNEYGLRTDSLRKMVNNWMDGIVTLRPLKQSTQDDHWLSACIPFDEKRLQILCDLIRIWVTATYVTSFRTSPPAKALAKKFLDKITFSELTALSSEETVCLSNKDGTVNDLAYKAIPLLTVNKLLGTILTVSGKELVLRYSAKNELISQPIEDEKTHHSYSYVFKFSIQTTPPNRRAMLLCEMSIRRWVYKRTSPDRKVHSDNAIVARMIMIQKQSNGKSKTKNAITYGTMRPCRTCLLCGKQ
jgi:hypothetical protein